MMIFKRYNNKIRHTFLRLTYSIKPQTKIKLQIKHKVNRMRIMITDILTYDYFWLPNIYICNTYVGVDFSGIVSLRFNGFRFHVV